MKTRYARAAGNLHRIMAHDDSQHPALKAHQNGWRELIKTIVYALLIAGGIRTAAAQPFNIPSGSMYGTLLIGDYLFVAKPSYGYSRYSLPWGHL
ncbi:MAG: S26 family signal peptidase, partial [Hyphomicrobiaceae bacterium]